MKKNHDYLYTFLQNIKCINQRLSLAEGINENSLPVLTQRWIIFSKPLDALTEIAENIYLDALILLNLRQSKEAFPIQA